MPSSRNPLPPNWGVLRKDVLHRDGHACQIRGPGCTYEAREVDHIMPRSMGGGHEPANLRAVCRTCHGARQYEHLGAMRDATSDADLPPEPDRWGTNDDGEPRLSRNWLAGPPDLAPVG